MMIRSSLTSELVCSGSDVVNLHAFHPQQMKRNKLVKYKLKINGAVKIIILPASLSRGLKYDVRVGITYIEKQLL